jgi:hypothetical protein
MPSICYFLRANGLDGKLLSIRLSDHRVPRVVQTSKFNKFASACDFKVFQGFKAGSKTMSMFEHFDVFR